MALTYQSYLKVDELLQLQQPLSDGPEHDETLFIIVHQVYELWFKQILHELAFLQRGLVSNDLYAALAGIRRVLTILKTLVAQLDVLETMTPLSFNSFRTRLESSSGFQSAQFREVEFRLGHKNPARIRIHPEGSHERARLETAMNEPSVYDALLQFLSQAGIEIPAEVLQRDFSAPNPEDETVRRSIIEIYRSRPDLAQICERFVDLDEGIQEWRYRHVKMVERTIGAKMGSGGSAGAEYLRKTLFTPLFPDLWSVRDKF